MSAEPLYVAPTSFNYHLDDSSPCLDAGTTAGAPVVDIAGSSRADTVTGMVDMGAFEETP